MVDRILVGIMQIGLDFDARSDTMYSVLCDAFGDKYPFASPIDKPVYSE
jgi:hypothetical protein